MQAMLKLTEEKQKRMKKKVINMDFEINPNLKLPHQLMLKNQENGGEVLVETLPLNQTQIIPPSIPIFPLPASISRSSPLAIPFPSALNPAKLHVTDDALFDLPLNILFPSTADRNVGSSSESLQIYPLNMIVVNPTRVIGTAGGNGFGLVLQCLCSTSSHLR